MQVQPQITFRDINHSPQVEDYIQDKIKKLEQFSSDIVSCQIVLSKDTHHHKGPENYDAHIKLAIPKKELVSTQNKTDNLYKSIDDAFDRIRRQLNNEH